MGLFDWLFEKKREKEALEQFVQMELEYKSIRLEEGIVTQEGGVVCPGCGYEMSIIEYFEQWQPGAARILICPCCHKKFKSH